MKKINAILLMGGTGQRMNMSLNKAIYEINELPLYMYSLLKFKKLKEIDEIYLVVNKLDKKIVENQIKINYSDVKIVDAGKTRAESVKNALRKIKNKNDVIIHDAARPLTSIKDIQKLIDETKEIGTLYHKVYDTIKQVSSTTKTINREALFGVTTPQYFKNELISKIIANENDFTDELQIFENTHTINYVEETSPNIKVTTKDDLEYAIFKLTPKCGLIGHSYDFHPFYESKKPLILGGVKIPYDKSLEGHSDADAVYHAVCEALLGALNKGDIGTLFPDDDPKYKDMDSSIFLKEAVRLVKEKHYKINNIDMIIYIEKPHLKAYKLQMAQNVKNLTNADFVNIKATTMEKQGLVGEEKGIGCEVVCMLSKEMGGNK